MTSASFYVLLAPLSAHTYILCKAAAVANLENAPAAAAAAAIHDSRTCLGCCPNAHTRQTPKSDPCGYDPPKVYFMTTSAKSQVSEPLPKALLATSLLAPAAKEEQGETAVAESAAVR